MKKMLTRWLTLLVVLAGTGVSIRAEDPTPAGDDRKAKVQAAVDSIRGADHAHMSDTDLKAFGKRLDAAWNVIRENPDEATPLVLAALAQETRDSFRIIDLAHLLLVLDEKRLPEVTAGLVKADPNAYPQGLFMLASGMASLHCAACLPASLKMLELRELDGAVPEHALPVDLELGILFTLGQYGDAAIDDAVAALKSKDCVVRGNAAIAVGVLLPRTEPAALRDIASEDPCEEARLKAWPALGLLDTVSLPRMVGKRLDSSPPPSSRERLAMATGLGTAFSPAVRKLLQRLSTDADREVAATAKQALDEYDQNAPKPSKLATTTGSASNARRSGALEKLRKAAREGRFEYEGEIRELVAALTPADLPLVNEARAAVLGRVSDECLDEYQKLSYAARALRSADRASGLAPPGRSAAD